MEKNRDNSEKKIAKKKIDGKHWDIWVELIQREHQKLTWEGNILGAERRGHSRRRYF